MDNLKTPSLSSNQMNEKVLKEMRFRFCGETSRIQQLGQQVNPWLGDAYAEALDLNRKTGEGIV